METVIMPKRLEKKDRASLMGKFAVSFPEYCNNCGGCGCPNCHGKGEIRRKINIPWVVIEEIYNTFVEELSYPLPNDDTEMTVHLSEGELKEIREELRHRINSDPLPPKEALLKKNLELAKKCHSLWILAKRRNHDPDRNYHPLQRHQGQRHGQLVSHPPVSYRSTRLAGHRLPCGD